MAREIFTRRHLEFAIEALSILQGGYLPFTSGKRVIFVWYRSFAYLSNTYILFLTNWMHFTLENRSNALQERLLLFTTREEWGLRHICVKKLSVTYRASCVWLSWPTQFWKLGLSLVGKLFYADESRLQKHSSNVKISHAVDRKRVCQRLLLKLLPRLYRINLSRTFISSPHFLLLVSTLGDSEDWTWKI